MALRLMRRARGQASPRVRPADAGEVQGCVLAANAHRVPLYPVSGGRNWSFGSRVPVADGSVVLDLGRLDRIVGPDEGLGWTTATCAASASVDSLRVHRVSASS